jgi:GNAT superfamily N-acetyltransferase
MAVEAPLRGRGVGSRLLERQLTLVREREPAYAVALSTQRAENVTFYRRLGFAPVRESTVGRGPRAFRNWTMLYAPAA